MEKTGLLQQLVRENVYRATTILGGSSMKAYEDALTWLKQTTGIIEP